MALLTPPPALPNDKAGEICSSPLTKLSQTAIWLTFDNADQRDLWCCYVLRLTVSPKGEECLISHQQTQTMTKTKSDHDFLGLGAIAKIMPTALLGHAAMLTYTASTLFSLGSTWCFLVKCDCALQIANAMNWIIN